MLRGEGCGHAGAAPLAAVRGPQQVLVGDDVGPVVLAGVVDAQQDLGPAAQGRQHLQRLARQAGDAKHQQPAGQARGLLPRRPGRRPRQKGLMYRRAAGIGQPLGTSAVASPSVGGVDAEQSITLPAARASMGSTSR